MPTHPSYYMHNRHFECVDKLLANRLSNRASDGATIGKLAVQSKEDIEEMIKSESVTDIVEQIFNNVVS